jgi:ABC-2 type transport system ATP-binding protein
LGQDVVREPLAARRLLGYAPAEERSFYGRLSVLQNLEFFGALRGLTRQACRDRSMDLLPPLGLGDHLQARFADLSSGMKQSLALVRALLHAPPVLILDEPTRSLSPDLAARVQDLLLRLAHDEGRTILLATHNLGEAEVLSDRVAILQGGRILVQGPPAELCRRQGLDGPARLADLFQHVTRTAPEVEL